MYQLVVDDYLFDFSVLAKLRPRSVVLEAPQGFVRLLPRIARFLADRLGVDVTYKLEPAYGLCSVSLNVLSENREVVLVHLGHDFYPYPYCSLGGCQYRLPDRVVVVPGLYLGGDVEDLVKQVQGLNVKRVAIGFSTQHRRLAQQLAEKLRTEGFTVPYTGPLLGCYFAPYQRLRGQVDAFLVVAGGRFHALGLALGLSVEEHVYRVDPYRTVVEPIDDEAARVLAKRLWAMQQFREATRVAVIAGRFPGQHRPGIVAAMKKLLESHGKSYDVILAGHLTRELIDNLDPGSYDAYIVTSCPRLAVDDLGDYWKPVLAPGEAAAALRGGRYIFPW